MVYVFIHFYYLFITYKLHIDDKVEIFNKGKQVLEVNFGLGVKDVNQNHFDVPGHQGYYAYQWFRNLSYSAVKLLSIAFVSIVIKTITGIVAVMSRYHRAQINRYYQMVSASNGAYVIMMTQQLIGIYQVTLYIEFNSDFFWKGRFIVYIPFCILQIFLIRGFCDCLDLENQEYNRITKNRKVSMDFYSVIQEQHDMNKS